MTPAEKGVKRARVAVASEAQDDEEVEVEVEEEIEEEPEEPAEPEWLVGLPRATGTIKMWNDEKGFGFIQPSEPGEDIFAHKSALASKVRYPKGTAVEYVVEWDDWKGTYRAATSSVRRQQTRAQKDLSKPARRATSADLRRGTLVIYWDEIQGFIRGRDICKHTKAATFQVADLATGALVCGEDGNVVAFKAKELWLPAQKHHSPPHAPSRAWGGFARVLLVGREEHMECILENFGDPGVDQRHNPQQLLAIPCKSCLCHSSCERYDASLREMCDPTVCPLLHDAVDGVAADVQELGRKMRSDIHVAVRALHLKQAVEQMGGAKILNSLDGFYCLSAVTVPYSWEDIEASKGWERYRREQVFCQIDLGVTAGGRSAAAEASPEVTAKRHLGSMIGVALSDAVWTEEVQQAVRESLGVPSLPLRFQDGAETTVFIILLSDSVVGVVDNGIVWFSDPAEAAAESDPEPDAEEAPIVRSQETSAVKKASSDPPKVAEKTIGQWKKEQDTEFAGLPPLPKGWIRIRSRKDNQIYYFNKLTQESTFEQPLPDGWTKKSSKSTEKTYYYNTKTGKSTFEVPTE
eukprot:gnl/TRDRNA2_/TRDRNA2_170611_c0_seq1.p1 gnl/TRDRNA2_/TRDRNA2_170611_c0~~gnl/TRDRNA2_/TRDRNA2_170611_c0_seq1.p1  ORF type:complete len:631 (-),score=110.21 gnl/TRDRNA2_/TRDRNA2_170611_c0_seq1:69-1802(-)